MLNYPYDEGVEILKGYRDDSELAKLYIQEVIIWKGGVYDETEDLDNLFKELENKHSKEWLIDILLSIEPEDVNEDSDLEYIDSLSVLKYIGNVDQFRDKFTRWLNTYESGFNRGTKVEDVLKEYMTMVAKYLSFIPECISVYKKLKTIKENEEDYNFNEIGELMYKITG